MRVLLISLIIFTGILTIHAQYINTDSLINIPGLKEPVTLFEFNSLLERSKNTDYQSIDLAQFKNISFHSHLPAQFSFPCRGKIISPFGPRSGRMHTGTDIKLNKGDTVYSVFHGTVRRAAYYYGYGNMVVVDHGNNLTTSYAHLSKILVSREETVMKEQPLGLAGSTGRATTSHLHFEIRESEKPFDPELVFDFEKGIIREEVQITQNLAELNNLLKPKGYSANDPVPQHYNIKYGDSLWKISRRFKTSVRRLCELNNLNENSVLQPGMLLKLY
jgi:murein DD-endopeptidase MepM/ murein hydrolase activator NlpD